MKQIEPFFDYSKQTLPNNSYWTLYKG